MKIKKLSTNQIFGLIIIGYILYIVTLSLLGISNSFWTAASNPVVYRDTLKPIDALIPDTVPFKKYNKLKDSIIRIRDLKNGDSWPADGTSFYISGLIGTSSSLSCDTCSLKMFDEAMAKNTNKVPVRYYINLPAWTLNVKNTTYTDDIDERPWTLRTVFNPDSVQFYVSHDQAYLRKIVPKQQLTIKNDQVKYKIVDVPVKFRYNKQNKWLMIPVSKSTKKTLDIVAIALGIVYLLYFLLLIASFIKFVIDLSKGLAFTNENLKRLKFIAFSLLAYPVLTLLFNILMRLIFYSYFTRDVILSSTVWGNSWKTILAGFVFYVLFRAFSQGKILKEEQDLTV
jgi:hypothetical protein